MNTDKKSHLTPQSESLQIDLARVRLLLEQGPTAIITAIFVSYVMAALLWEELGQAFVYGWISTVSLAGILRLILIKHIRNKLSDKGSPPPSLTIRKYERRYALGSFASGLTMGVISLTMEPSWSLTALLVIPLSIIGASAAALNSNSSSSLTYYCFTAPLLLPLLYWFYDNEQLFGVLLLTIYSAMMVVSTKRIHNFIVDNIKLRLHNVELVEDLTENNQQQTKLLLQLGESEKLASGAFDKAGVAMGLVDKDMILFKVNQKASDLIGYSIDEMIGMSILPLSHEDDRAQSEKLFTELVLGKREQYQLRKRYLRKGGASTWVNAIVSSVDDDEGNFEYAIIHAQDISQEYELTKELTHQAQHDPLTDLPNRYAFESRLESILESNNEDEHVLCYIDLDQFKVVNDTCGHIAGDELLRQLAQVLHRAIRKTDLLARIGGDEFAVLMLNCSMLAAQKQLEELLSKVRDFHFIYEGQSFNVGASLGLVSIDSNSTMTEALKQADSACYAAKEAGRDRLHIFSHDDEVLAQRSDEMQWVSKIQQALAKDLFVLYYQEIVQIDGKGKLPHYELLIRMKGEDGKIVPPGSFLPAAERYGLAAAIDLWVVEYVLTTLNVAHMEGKEISGVYGINISGHSLGDPRFYENIIKRISSSDLREFGAYICFEITETAAISNITGALHFINELRAVGCQFALDDFGSGLSSFAYLKQMPIDYLKIDGMFVKDCLTDPVNLEMIDSIHGIGHVMGLKTIAEFVENDEIFKKLGELGVDYAQGYWNGPPQPWIIEETEWEFETA